MPLSNVYQHIFGTSVQPLGSIVLDSLAESIFVYQQNLFLLFKGASFGDMLTHSLEV